MGSGTSRGKRVAPARVGEVNVTKPNPDPLKPPRNHSVWRNAPARAQPDRHGAGRDSDLSGEDGGADGELEGDPAAPGGRERASAEKTSPKKSSIRSRTYGLCHLGQEDAGEDVGPDPGLRASGGAGGPRVSHGGSKDVNKKDGSAAHLKRRAPACSTQMDSFLTRGALLEDVPTSEKQQTVGSCYSSSLTTPVIRYDGSEEELMDSIERDFS